MPRKVKGPSKTVRAREPKQPQGLVEVHLSVQHQINTTAYGPGTVRVPEKVAAVLREQERRFAESEEHFYANDRAYLIGAGNKRIRVHPDAFQSAWTSGNVFHGVAGGGEYRG